MFVLSMKTTRPRLAAVIAACGLLIAVLVGARGMSSAVPAGVGHAADPVAYLQSLGYAVESQWTALQEIAIPTAEDPAFAAYNAALQEVGYDLTPYAGQRIKQYTYAVQNHPTDPNAQAHVYVYKERVIAGEMVTATGERTPLEPLTKQGETNGTTG